MNKLQSVINLENSLYKHYAMVYVHKNDGLKSELDILKSDIIARYTEIREEPQIDTIGNYPIDYSYHLTDAQRAIKNEKLRALTHWNKTHLSIIKTHNRAIGINLKIDSKDTINISEIHNRVYINDRYIELFNWTYASILERFKVFARRYTSDKSVENLDFCAVELNYIFLKCLVSLVTYKHFTIDSIGDISLVTNIATREQRQHAFYIARAYIRNLLDKLSGRCGVYEDVKIEVNTLIDKERYNSVTVTEHTNTLERGKNTRAKNVDLRNVLETLDNRELQRIQKYNYRHRNDSDFSPITYGDITLYSDEEEGAIDFIKSHHPEPYEELQNKERNLLVMRIINNIVSTDSTFNRVYEFLCLARDGVKLSKSQLMVITRFKARNKLDLLDTEDLIELFC